MKRFWTAVEVDFLIENYPHKSTEFIAKQLSRTVCQVYNKAYGLGLKKTEQYMNELLSIEAERLKNYGKKTRFKKGNKSWNEGTKGVMKANSGSFKNGHIPATIKPVGSRRIDKDGHFVEKQPDGSWIKIQYVIWEKVNGKVPDGYVLRFKDGNPKNLHIDNLQVITKAENMKLNGIARLPKELRRTIYLIRRLNKIINEKQNSRP